MNFAATGADMEFNNKTRCSFTDTNVGPTKASEVVFKRCEQLCVITLDSYNKMFINNGLSFFLLRQEANIVQRSWEADVFLSLNNACWCKALK